MSNTAVLKALYYPFAQCAKPNSLKKAILLFDEIWLIDPTSERVRDELANDEWKYIRDVFGPLLDHKIALLYDAEQLVLGNDQLLSNAFKADLKDNDVWRLCTTPGTPETWDVLRRKVPPSAFEFLNSQTFGRINYGTARAKAVFHKEFMDWPDLRDYIAEDATDPFAVEDMGPYNMEEWHRFLFHDGKIAHEMNSWSFANEEDRKKYVDAEFSCVFPFTHASSLAVNQALLVSHEFGLVPFTDSMIHHQLLNVKYQRALHNMSLLKGPATSAVVRPTSAKLQMVCLSILDNVIPGEMLDRISMIEAVQFRDSSKQAFEHLRQQISELIAQIEAQVWDEKLETRIRKTIGKEIFSESRNAVKSAIAVYEELFGKVVIQQVASVTPAMKLSVFPGLGFLTILAVGSAHMAETVSPDVIKTYVEKTRKVRNSLTYLS